MVGSTDTTDKHYGTVGRDDLPILEDALKDAMRKAAPVGGVIKKTLVFSVHSWREESESCQLKRHTIERQIKDEIPTLAVLSSIDEINDSIQGQYHMLSRAELMYKLYLKDVGGPDAYVHVGPTSKGILLYQGDSRLYGLVDRAIQAAQNEHEFIEHDRESL